MAHHDEVAPEHDRGLSHDLPTLLSRRRALALFGGAGVAALAGCTTSTDEPRAAPSTAGTATPADATTSASPGTSAGTGTSAGAAAAAGEIPAETPGPYPADGSNGVNVLTASGIVRSDITRSFGAASGVARGVPLRIELTVVDLRNGAAGLAGAAVYLWHCDIDGKYSMYSEGVTEENYLRGVQEADGAGRVAFTSIYPAAYAGRWPHVHFEVYPSLAAATAASTKLRTSQLALPADTSRLVYATGGYGQSVRNLAQTSLETDNVFSDGYSLQLATVTGSVEGGLTATLAVPV